ncbi:hypothetical protein VC83_06237 [Pseudogymnoascus destructans]|uniref:Uncharacterized protein n=2 Tax=Pseudogymnoascus destructans TaxID=655981 RepID=L8GAM2_PSED2|nr:uncharacterized protein VC83_06237 [Pseudogymnoascus destructans]ELR09688.1 hypothetical protein GMDG_04174 [Pseudogymnoascus destructans 20631-21]OAF58982.1 hypothetical protein VC83_06237 [Pseudogymnoascus destructans]
MTDMSPCRLCAAPFPPVIVRIVGAPTLPALPEFEDKWPNFLDSPLSPLPHPSRSAKKQYYRLFPHQRAMPPTPPSSPRRLKPVSSDITAYDLHALSSISPMEQLFLVTPSSDTSSLSDPSIHSPSDEDDDYDTSGFPSWHNSYDFLATPSASPTELSPLYRCNSPSKFAFDISSMPPPPIPPRSPSLNSGDTTKSSRHPAPRPQAGPPLHFAAPRRAPPLVAPAFRHRATPPLPPLSRPGFAPPATIPPLHPSSYSTNTSPLSLSLPPSPLARAVPLPTSPVLAEKSVFDHEEEGVKGLKGVKARFHKHGAASGAQGGRRKSAGEVVKGIFGGWSEKGGRGGKGT